MSKSASDIRNEIDADLNGLKSLSALGLWTRMRPWIESSSHDGHLEIDGLAGTLERLARKLNRTPDQLSRPLAALEKKHLIAVSSAGVVTSEPLKKLRIALRRNAEKQLRHRNKGYGGYVTPGRGVTEGVTRGVTDPPPFSPSPTPPTSYPPTPIPFPTGTAGAAVPAKKRAKAKEPVFPPGVWDRAVGGWKTAYRHVHGVEPSPCPRGFKGLKSMLVALESDVEALANVIRAGLREPERGIWQGHKLHVIADNLDYLRGKIAKGTVGHGVAKPSAAERGEYAEQPIHLPERRRTVGSGA